MKLQSFLLRRPPLANRPVKVPIISTSLVGRPSPDGSWVSLWCFYVKDRRQLTHWAAWVWSPNPFVANRALPAVRLVYLLLRHALLGYWVSRWAATADNKPGAVMGPGMSPRTPSPLASLSLRWTNLAVLDAFFEAKLWWFSTLARSSQILYVAGIFR